VFFLSESPKSDIFPGLRLPFQQDGTAPMVAQTPKPVNSGGAGKERIFRMIWDGSRAGNFSLPFSAFLLKSEP
jgi:hypothetical protein